MLDEIWYFSDFFLFICQDFVLYKNIYELKKTQWKNPQKLTTFQKKPYTLKNNRENTDMDRHGEIDTKTDLEKELEGGDLKNSLMHKSNDQHHFNRTCIGKYFQA